MNFDNLNRWLTLLANLGVVARIVFLSLEIDQSNRIAEREARSELLAFITEINRSSQENPEIAELMVKLRSFEPELSEDEEYRSYSFAMLQLNQAIRLNATYEEGFLPGNVFARNLMGARNNIAGFPGLAPFLRQAIEDLGLAEVAFGENATLALKNLGDEIIRIERLYSVDKQTAPEGHIDQFNEAICAQEKSCVSEYELASLLRETAATISQDFEFFITATFAVIFVSYAVGDKLKPLPRIVISLLYLGSVALVLVRYQNLLPQVEFIVVSLRDMDSEFPVGSNLNVNLVSPIRQFILVFGSIAAI